MTVVLNRVNAKPGTLGPIAKSIYVAALCEVTTDSVLHDTSGALYRFQKRRVYAKKTGWESVATTTHVLKWTLIAETEHASL